MNYIDAIVNQIIEKADAKLPRIFGSSESMLGVAKTAYQFYRYGYGSDTVKVSIEKSTEYGNEYYRVSGMLEEVAKKSSQILTIFDNDAGQFSNVFLRYANNIFVFWLIKIERGCYERMEIDEFISNNNRWLDPDDNPEHADYIDNIESKYKDWYQPLSNEDLRKINELLKLLRTNGNSSE